MAGVKADEDDAWCAQCCDRCRELRSILSRFEHEINKIVCPIALRSFCLVSDILMSNFGR